MKTICTPSNNVYLHLSVFLHFSSVHWFQQLFLVVEHNSICFFLTTMMHILIIQQSSPKYKSYFHSDNITLDRLTKIFTRKWNKTVLLPEQRYYLSNLVWLWIWLRRKYKMLHHRCWNNIHAASSIDDKHVYLIPTANHHIQDRRLSLIFTLNFWGNMNKPNAKFLFRTIVSHVI